MFKTFDWFKSEEEAQFGENIIDHFRVALNLIMKARLSAKFLL